MQTTSHLNQTEPTVKIFIDPFPDRYWAHAGPASTEVLITAHAVYDAEGVEVEATVDGERKLILISDRVPLGERCRALLAQMHVVHNALFGVPRSDDEARQRRAVVFAQLKRDLNRQGGADKLLGLRPYGEPKTQNGVDDR
jgi:hypothetical protein